MPCRSRSQSLRIAIRAGRAGRLVAGAVLLIEAVVAKNVLDVRLDYWSQFVAMWIFIAYQWFGHHDRLSELLAIAAILTAAAAVPIVYGI